MSDRCEGLPSLEIIQTRVDDGSFEEALAALEAVVDRLDRGRLSIDEALRWYETGLKLTRRCTDLLAHAELRIHMLESTYALSSEDAKPWDTDES